MRVVLFGSLIVNNLLAAALPAQYTFAASNGCTLNPAPNIAGTYYGTGRPPNSTVPTLLRISNGGAGLSGLIGALADEFIDFKSGQSKDNKLTPFKIEWVKGDTTETLSYLSTGQADVGVTYNKAAECQSYNQGIANRRVYGFRDHFYLVGPLGPSNPAGLKPYQPGSSENENILDQFQAIVRTGNEDLDPPTRFLSRYDKSATNIKEAELFTLIGQVPWAWAYSKWYHQYPRYPINALQASALLQEYTITDRGTWLSTNKTYTTMLTRYNEGTDDPNEDDPTAPLKPTDLLLNPAFFLSSSRTCPETLNLANEFLDWVVSEAGQSIIGNFTGQIGGSEILYTRAPTRQDLPIKNCSVSGL